MLDFLYAVAWILVGFLLALFAVGAFLLNVGRKMKWPGC